MSTASDADDDQTGRFVRQPNGRIRPLSPHLQIWRWHITMLASILFRVTIGAASFAAILVIGWLTAVAFGPEAFAAVGAFMGSPLGLIIGFGLTLVLLSFVLNGARMLVNVVLLLPVRSVDVRPVGIRTGCHERWLTADGVKVLSLPSSPWSPPVVGGSVALTANSAATFV